MDARSDTDRREGEESWDILALLLASEPKPGSEDLYEELVRRAVRRALRLAIRQEGEREE